MLLIQIMHPCIDRDFRMCIIWMISHADFIKTIVMCYAIMWHLGIFHITIIDPVNSKGSQTALTPKAVYAIRLRLNKMLKSKQDFKLTSSPIDFNRTI